MKQERHALEATTARRLSWHCSRVRWWVAALAIVTLLHGCTEPSERDPQALTDASPGTDVQEVQSEVDPSDIPPLHDDVRDADPHRPADVDTADDLDTTPPEPHDPCVGGETRVALISTLTFAREEPGRITRGFDLDGHVTQSTRDPIGCGKTDMTSPEGVPGIDNQFARFLPTLESVGGEALESLIQYAINNGELLLMLEISQLHDETNDTCVIFSLGRGKGEPFVSSFGLPLPGQTFDRDPDFNLTRIEDVSVVDGRLDAGPFVLEIPVQIFDTLVELTALETFARIEIGEEGAISGFVGGILLVEEILRIVPELGDESISGVIESVIWNVADILPDDDGVCHGISFTLDFETVPAYLFD